MTDIPVLDGERVRLREHRADDLGAYTALWADEEVVRFIGGKPLRRDDCWGRILRTRGMWALLGFGFWIIEDRRTGALIGEAGLMDMKREIEPSLDGTIEAGWALLPAFHGQGFAGEAMRLVLDWGDRILPGVPQSCIISEANEASLQLAARLGFKQSGRGTYRDATLIHFQRVAVSSS
jgi:RimJ/RimL family protein N-acetyltransferase